MKRVGKRDGTGYLVTGSASVAAIHMPNFALSDNHICLIYSSGNIMQATFGSHFFLFLCAYFLFLVLFVAGSFLLVGWRSIFTITTPTIIPNS